MSEYISFWYLSHSSDNQSEKCSCLFRLFTFVFFFLHKIHLRNEFDFGKVLGIKNTSGLLQSK